MSLSCENLKFMIKLKKEKKKTTKLHHKLYQHKCHLFGLYHLNVSADTKQLKHTISQKYPFTHSNIIKELNLWRKKDFNIFYTVTHTHKYKQTQSNYNKNHINIRFHIHTCL